MVFSPRLPVPNVADLVLELSTDWVPWFWRRSLVSFCDVTCEVKCRFAALQLFNSRFELYCESVADCLYWLRRRIVTRWSRRWRGRCLCSLHSSSLVQVYTGDRIQTRDVREQIFFVPNPSHFHSLWATQPRRLGIYEEFFCGRHACSDPPPQPTMLFALTPKLLDKLH